MKGLRQLRVHEATAYTRVADEDVACHPGPCPTCCQHSQQCLFGASVYTDMYHGPLEAAYHNAAVQASGCMLTNPRVSCHMDASQTIAKRMLYTLTTMTDISKVVSRQQ